MDVLKKYITKFFNENNLSIEEQLEVDEEINQYKIPYINSKGETYILFLHVYETDEGDNVFEISAPVLSIPINTNLTAFYKRLLELNSSFVESAFYMENEKIVICSNRYINTSGFSVDFDYSEFKDMFSSIIYCLDFALPQIKGEFF